jgi:hypothetical protein
MRFSSLSALKIAAISCSMDILHHLISMYVNMVSKPGGVVNREREIFAVSQEKQEIILDSSPTLWFILVGNRRG